MWTMCLCSSWEVIFINAGQRIHFSMNVLQHKFYFKAKPIATIKKEQTVSKTQLLRVA